MISLPINDNCTFLRELALELDGALGSLERCLIFRLGPSFDTFTITTNTVSSIDMYISQRQPAILDVREDPSNQSTYTHILITSQAYL